VRFFVQFFEISKYAQHVFQTREREIYSHVPKHYSRQYNSTE
jgi:hypothetical protein